MSFGRGNLCWGGGSHCNQKATPDVRQHDRERKSKVYSGEENVGHI